MSWISFPASICCDGATAVVRMRSCTQVSSLRRLQETIEWYTLLNLLNVGSRTAYDPWWAVLYSYRVTYCRQFPGKRFGNSLLGYSRSRRTQHADGTVTTHTYTHAHIHCFSLWSFVAIVRPSPPCQYPRTVTFLYILLQPHAGF